MSKSKNIKSDLALVLDVLSSLDAGPVDPEVLLESFKHFANSHHETLTYLEEVLQENEDLKLKLERYENLFPNL